MKTLGVVLATLAMIASVLVMPVASSDEGDLQAIISGDDGETSFASENGTAVFTVDISSASGAAHSNVAVGVTFEGAGWESDQATISDCSGKGTPGSNNTGDLAEGGTSTACISVKIMGSDSVGGDVGMAVTVTSDEDATGISTTGMIKISNWIVYSNDGVQSYSENETHQYTLTVENIMLDADGAGVDLDEPVKITFVGTSGGWNIDSSSPAWDKPSLTATINFISSNGSVDLVLDIQLVGQIELSSSYTGAPGTIVFNAFDESETPVTTLVSLYAEIAAFTAVHVTSSSDDTDVWDASTTQVDNGCTNIDAAIAFDISVFNHGNDRDSFDVTFDTTNAGGWTVTGVDSFTTASLEPKKYDGVESFGVGFLIPSGLAAGTTQSFSMTAMSTTDSVSQTQTFSATIAQCYGFDMTVDSLMNSADPESDTDFTFTVSNTGNSVDTFTYMVMGAAAWTPSLASTETEMAALKVSEIQEIIREIGLAPTKAKNLQRMAQQLIDGGGMRADWDFLESLAGVGHKTASVVMAQWYGIPAFPVDTHIHRLAQRWGLSEGRNVVQVEKDLKALWAEELWITRHLQIIFFGREYCPARSHDLANCQICGWAATKKRIREEAKR